jgi:hypothetical protein
MTDLAALISLIVPIVIGFAFVRVCIPGEKCFCRHDWLRLFLGIGTGFGICSCALFVWLLTYGTVHVLYIVFETAIGVILVTFAAFRATGCCLCKWPPAPHTGLTRWKHQLLIAFGLIFLAGCLSFALESRIRPDGQGDAWAIWNLRARFLLRGGGQWRSAFSGILFWSHPDYPILLPASVARSWIYTGKETATVPIGIAALFTFAGVGVLTTSISLLGGREKGLLAGIVLLGTPSFINLGAAQYADVPAAFFFLASIVLLCLRDRILVSGTALLGLTTALAAWTKNEGLLFLGLLLITMKWTRQAAVALMWGASGVLALLAIFKLRLAPPDYLTQNTRTTLVRAVMDPSRYLTVAAGFAYQLINFGGTRLNPLVPFLAALALMEHSVARATRSAAFILPGMLVGVFLVYLVTPFDPVWQIAWSLDRLLLQLWPAALFTCLQLIDFPIPRDSAK